MTEPGAGDATLLHRIGAEVERAPARVAVECGGRSLTYAALWARAGAIAHQLIAGGATPGTLIGLCVPRSVEMPAALIGILRAGCAYIPLDPGFPDRRLQQMIELADLRRIVVLGREHLPDAVASGRSELTEIANAGRTETATGAFPDVRGDDLAYVLFTSGSTGTPKGVRVLHRNLSNFLESMRETPGFTSSDVLCAVTTLSFDIAGLEMYLPLTVGGRVVIADEQQVRDPNALLDLIRTSGVSVLQTTPTLLRLLCDDGRIGGLDGLKLLVGGEAFPRDLANAALAHCRELWNMYGPTETTIWSTVGRVVAGDGPVALGGPIANTQIHLLDGENRPVAGDARGEIWIGGAGVADGYLGRADLTAERFRPDPFAADGSRMYRTGDIGSLKDGVLHFHGRGDDQVKLRGFRIELGDVESAAYGDPRVREAAAAVRAFGDNDMRLVLYVVPRETEGDLVASLRDRLRDSVPPYMRPSHIVVLETLPHTPNGKIDRKALPLPPDDGGASAITGDDREHYLAALWREMLGVAQIGSTDNFFELGGDSLLAVAMLTRLGRETGVQLNVMQIANGTLASIAGKLPHGAPLKAGAENWFARLLRKWGVRAAGRETPQRENATHE